MSDMPLDELVIAASESDEKIAPLLKKLLSLEDLTAEDVPEQLEFLLESWGGNLAAEARARFCLELATQGVGDTPLFRNALNDSIKSLLPPYMNKTGFFRALGLRDSDLPLSEVAHRFAALLKLKSGVFTFQMDSKSWGKVASIDDFVGSVSLATVNGTSARSVPLTTVLSSLFLFEGGNDMVKIASPDRRNSPDASVYREKLTTKVLLPTDEETLKMIAYYTLVPDTIAPPKFDSWWASGAPGQKKVSVFTGRRPSEARSVHEMQVLLQDMDVPEDFTFDDDDVALFRTFFERYKAKPMTKDNLQLADVVGLLLPYLDEEQVRQVFEPLNGKCPFWPEEPEDVKLPELEVWGKLKVAQLSPFIKVTALIYSTDYLADIAAHLPLRCLNEICANLSDEQIKNAVLGTHTCSCDILVWVWKNRKKHSAELLKTLNIDNIVDALSIFDLPKEWGSAQRELKKLLMENAEFQKLIIDNAGDEVALVAYAMRRAKTLGPGEQQSLVVKLARHSQLLREVLEKGEGRKLMGDAAEKAAEAQAAMQPIVTSIWSFKELQRTLDDIVKVQIPENRTAIKVAREHGDFRENAEYDAAKERRNFLTHRRSELERDIISIQPMDFRDVKVGDTVVVGCTVNIAKESGNEVYHVVGARDGDEKLNCLSYKTKLGEILMNKKVGSDVEFLDGTNGKIESVTTLPTELLDKFSDEK